MSDLTKRDAELLMSLVDAEIRRICKESKQDDVPHIAAECAECGFLFDLKFGTDCPACHHTGVKWAQLITEQEAKARTNLRTELESIAECEAIFALKDNR
jgi:predicted Zn-ribbon and HTH transcriptional regulator